VLTPEDEARWRDQWTVLLLEATSDPDALRRVRREASEGRPAYDDVADPYPSCIQPRDLIAACPRCARRFVNSGQGGKVYCSKACGSAVCRARRTAA
jgi:hypothetical protein